MAGLLTDPPPAAGAGRTRSGGGRNVLRRVVDWLVTYVIALPCVDVKDRACIDECPVDCIYEGERSLYIHPDECVDCGACEPVCPVEAIYYEDDLPEQWADYYKANVEFFDDVGSPGRRRQGRRDRQGPPDHRRAAAAGARLSPSWRSRELPDYPWDAVAPYAERARAHPDGIVDLSIGSPVDPTPDARPRRALAAATDAHAYPQTVGTPALREAIVDWFARRRGVAGLTRRRTSCPRSGRRSSSRSCRSCWVSGRATSSCIRAPRIRPTRSAPRSPGRRPLACDDPAEWPEGTRLVWLNTPGNPDGRVLEVDELARGGRPRPRARRGDRVSDECYAELGWDAPWDARAHPVGILDPRVTDGDVRGILLASTRSASSRTSPATAPRSSPAMPHARRRARHRAQALGLMLPAPVQAAMIAALGDDDHVAAQKERYRAPARACSSPRSRRAGFRIDGSEAGLYLWATEGRDAWESIGAPRRLGILAGPGTSTARTSPSTCGCR